MTLIGRLLMPPISEPRHMNFISLCVNSVPWWGVTTGKRTDRRPEVVSSQYRLVSPSSLGDWLGKSTARS